MTTSKRGSEGTEPLQRRAKLGGGRRRERELRIRVCDQEYEVGLRSLAVPVFSPNGRAVATLNLSGSAPRLSTLEMQTRFLSHLRNAASELAVFLR